MRKANKDVQRFGWKPPTAFGDMVTIDHEVIAERNAQNQCRRGDKYTAVVQDYFTSWLDAFPVNSKDGDDAILACRQFFGPDIIPKAIYSDYSKAFVSMSATELFACRLHTAYSRNKRNCGTVCAQV